MILKIEIDTSGEAFNAGHYSSEKELTWILSGITAEIITVGLADFTPLIDSFNQPCGTVTYE